MVNASYLRAGGGGGGGGGASAAAASVNVLNPDDCVTRSSREREHHRYSRGWPNVKMFVIRNRTKDKRSKHVSDDQDEEVFSVDKWRGLLLSVAKTATMYAERYTAAAESEKLVAQEKKGRRARTAATEKAALNECRAKALVRLAALAHQLHVRESPKECCMLIAVEEVARCEMVSLVFAAARLDVQPLSEVVALLRCVFPDDVDAVIQGKEPWGDMVDSALFAALTQCPREEEEGAKHRVDTVSGLFRVVPLTAIENRMATTGNEARLDNRALFQTLEQNHRVSEDRACAETTTIMNRTPSIDGNTARMVMEAKDVPILRPVAVRSYNGLPFGEDMGVQENCMVRNKEQGNRKGVEKKNKSDSEKSQSNIESDMKIESGIDAIPDFAELEDIIVPVREISAKGNVRVDSKAVSIGRTKEGKSKKISSTKAVAKGKGFVRANDGEDGICEAKEVRIMKMGMDETITADGVVIGELVTEQQGQQKARQKATDVESLLEVKKENLIAHTPTSPLSSDDGNNKEMPRIPAPRAKRTSSGRANQLSLRAATKRLSVDFRRRSLDNSGTVGSSVTAEESDEAAAAAKKRKKAKLKAAAFVNRVRRSRQSAEKSERGGGGGDGTGEESQKFNRKSKDSTPKAGAGNGKKGPAKLKRILRKRKTGTHGLVGSKSMDNIAAFARRHVTKRNVDDGEVRVGGIDESKLITRAILFTCYPGVSEVRKEEDGGCMLRFSDRNNALKFLNDKNTIANTFGKDAVAVLVRGKDGGGGGGKW